MCWATGKFMNYNAIYAIFLFLLKNQSQKPYISLLSTKKGFFSKDGLTQILVGLAVQTSLWYP
jgi:hypothetical protein